MATGRYSTFPTVIDKLKLLPELKDMTVEQVGKIARYNELIIKGKNGTLTSAEQLELDALHQEMKTYNLSPTDWNTVISAMINIEKYFNDTILPEIETMVDNAELQINTSVTNGVSVVDNKVNSVIPQIDKYISDLITNPTNAVTIGHLRNQFIITNETNIIAIGIHGFNANTDVLTLTVSGTQYYEYKNGNGDYTIDTSNNTITLVGTKKFYVDEIVLIEVVKNVMKNIPTMDVSLVADNSILRVKLDQDTQNAINDIANKQNKTDNTLTTTDKTIVGGINEVNEHLGEKASLTKLGHVKAETDLDGKLILGIPKSNYNAVTLPTLNDDETKGYSVGSMWFVTVEGQQSSYVCLDATSSGAIWENYVAINGMTTPLYVEGTEYISFSGVKEEASETSGVVSKNPDHLYIYATRYNTIAKSSGFISDQQISLSDISLLHFEINYESGNTTTYSFECGVSTNRNILDTFVAFVSIKAIQPGRYIVSVDVSGLSGFYFIKTKATGNSTITSTAKIYKIWGEK